MPANRSQRGVLVYRSELLPFSETFVRAQAHSLRRYDPVFVGRTLVPAADLGGIPAVVPEQRSRIARAVLRRIGHEYSPAQLRRLTQAQPALIHAHFGPDAIAALPLSRKLALPLLATFHGYDATRDMSASADAHQQNYRDALPSLFKKVTRIIAVSDYIRERVIALGAPPERTYTHYIGVDTTRFSPAGERDPSLVLAVGRFVEKKGFEDLIRAFGAVASTRPDARLVMLGDGPLRGELERMARAQSGRIELLGAVPSEEVLSWLRRAAILAAPSVTASDGDTEGLPTIVVESMACGTPVLATQHAGTPEAILHERTGLLVPERATEALSSALSRLLADHALRQALGAAGRARALDEFDLTAQVGKLEAHYDAAARDGCRT